MLGLQHQMWCRNRGRYIHFVLVNDNISVVNGPKLALGVDVDRCGLHQLYVLVLLLHLLQVGRAAHEPCRRQSWRNIRESFPTKGTVWWILQPFMSVCWQCYLTYIYVYVHDIHLSLEITENLCIRQITMWVMPVNSTVSTSINYQVPVYIHTLRLLIIHWFLDLLRSGTAWFRIQHGQVLDSK